MKTLILAAALGFTACAAFAQGQFNFGNRVSGVVDAPVFGPDGTTKLDGDAWLAQAYVKRSADPETSYEAVGTAVKFRTGAAAGYISSTMVTTPFPGGTEIYVEMRVWEAAKGDTYESALAAKGYAGRFSPVTLTVAVAPNTPPDMVGLVSFSCPGCWGPFPEPPQVTSQPSGVRVPVDSVLTLGVSVTGTPPLAYQWYRAGLLVAGAASNVLTIARAQVADAGNYQMTVRNSWGSATSEVARVVVGYRLILATRGAGSIEVQPAFEVFEPGQSVELKAIPADGRAFLGWQGDASGTSNPLILTMNGAKHVQVLFSSLPGDLKWEFTFELLTVPGYSATWGYGINNAGDVVFTAGANEASFLRDSSGAIAPIQYPERSPTVALGISNRGTIVGDVWDPATKSYIGFIRTDDGQFSNFTYPGASGMQVNAINDTGVILGIYSVSETDAGSFLRSPTREFQPFRYLDDPRTWGQGINAQGQISGQSDSGSFLRNPDGTYTPIAVPGAMETRAHGINNAGEIVGLYIDGGNGAHGFVRDSGGAFHDVEVSGAEYAHPWGINDSGQLVGTTVIDDRPYAFIATRVGAPPRIEKQPSVAVLKEGQEGRIMVRVSGNPAPQVQWFLGSAAVPDGTNVTLILPAVTRALEDIYWLMASNALGRATSAPIVAVVSNVDPLRYPAWRWEGEVGALTVQLAPSVNGPWADLGGFHASTTSGVYVETNLVWASLFYRLLDGGGAPPRFTATTLVPGWWSQAPVGSRHRIEYVWSGSGWSNWVFLTELTLPASPHLFQDTEAFHHPGGVYRTTPVP